mmetsp:Transcript_15379/g.42531  ORF Transcript_15379/g.42531 Transcript_15379/m.42531 type:complete len:261 (+) Transcript_15379:551-1333(+)
MIANSMGVLEFAFLKERLWSQRGSVSLCPFPVLFCAHSQLIFSPCSSYFLTQRSHASPFICFLFLSLFSFVTRSYLDAGPLVLIVSGLVAIFTFGLGDDQNKEGLSAYSVFNRGFQRILGSVDADALLAQHVGMGMAAAAIPNQQAFRHDDDGDNHNNNNHNRGGRRRQQQQADNDRDREPIAVNGADDGNNRPEQGARKSGKKLRRKNQEHKVELRRQREAAIAMGFNGQGNREEMMAMQQLLEDQVRENERNMNGGAD